MSKTTATSGNLTSVDTAGSIEFEFGSMHLISHNVGEVISYSPLVTASLQMADVCGLMCK